MSSAKDEYLKRYLSGDSRGEKKRSSKKKVATTTTKSTTPKTGFKIIEDDPDLPYHQPRQETEKIEDDEADDDEIAPVVALVNNKTDELKLLGKFQTANWTALQDEAGDTASTSRRVRRHDSDDDNDESPPRRRDDVDNNNGGDQSPPRRVRRQASDDDDPSPPRRRNDSSDASPVRRPRSDVLQDNDISPPRGRRRHNSGGDRSLPRRRRNSDGDQSPPRRGRVPANHSHQPARRRHDSSGDDQSPPRRGRKSPAADRAASAGQWFSSPPQRRRRYDSGSSTQPGPSGGGSRPRRRHDSGDRGPPAAIAGGSSPLTFHGDQQQQGSIAPIKRSIRRKKPELTEEQKERAKEMEKKYAVWSKGQKQVQEREQKLSEMAAEAAKPFARHRDDEDLEAHLKNIEYNDDPMLEYMREKKQKETGAVAKPKYQGPWPSNRYGIPPGYRWDGVDRSNGFEEKLMTSKNVKKADEEEYYKWTSGRFE